MIESYRTLKRQSVCELTERKSRFLGFAGPLASADAAEAWLSALRREYPDATHHVFAYDLIMPERFSRFSDDGEPKGTAGPPLLDALTGRSLTQCGVVVVRYFGGTLLGTGGLVRAYGRTAAEAITAAEPIEMQRRSVIKVTIGYERADRLMEALRRRLVTVESVGYAEKVSFEALFAEEDEAIFYDTLGQIAQGGETVIEKTDPRYVAVALEDTEAGI
jgi:uncharacterized YigZ family protein